MALGLSRSDAASGRRWRRWTYWPCFKASPASRISPIGPVNWPGDCSSWRAWRPLALASRARQSLESGRAWAKFKRICQAQGGMRSPPVARFQRDLTAPSSGRIASIDNRKLATVAKLAGAPMAKAAGVAVHARLGQSIVAGSPLCTLHAESPGELDYAAAFALSDGAIFAIAAP